MSLKQMSVLTFLVNVFTIWLCMFPVTVVIVISVMSVGVMWHVTWLLAPVCSVSLTPLLLDNVLVMMTY